MPERKNMRRGTVAEDEGNALGNVFLIYGRFIKKTTVTGYAIRDLFEMADSMMKMMMMKEGKIKGICCKIYGKEGKRNEK